MTNSSQGPISDYSRQAEGYDRGRSLRSTSFALIESMLRECTNGLDVRRIVDLGSGTGRFSTALTGWFDAEVIAIEPHPDMRAQAMEKADSRVEIRDGSAYETGLDNSAVDLVWLANVAHHLRPLLPAANEIFRVTRDGGRLVITNGLGDSPDSVPEADWFPESIDVAQRLLPTFDHLVETMTAAGFSYKSRQRREDVYAETLTELYERVRTRSFSTLQQLPDTTFESRLEQLRLAAEHDPQRQTIFTRHMLRFDK